MVGSSDADRGPLLRSLELGDDFASNLAAFHQGVDIALSLVLLKTTLGADLIDYVIRIPDRGQILRGKLAPLRADLLLKRGSAIVFEESSCAGH